MKIDTIEKVQKWLRELSKDKDNAILDTYYTFKKVYVNDLNIVLNDKEFLQMLVEENLEDEYFED